MHVPCDYVACKRRREGGIEERAGRMKEEKKEEKRVKSKEMDDFEMAIENRCPRSYQCEYNPHGTEPNIDSVIDSLNDAVK